MHSPTLSKSAQTVQDVLSKKGIQFRVVELPESTHTAQQAATAIGCQITQIIKSLIFKTVTTHQPILVLASGPTRVQEKMIEAQLGEKITKADADFTKEVTGFVIGGVPPVGHKQPIKTFIDKDLLQLGELWAAAGTPHAVFSLQATDLPILTDGTLIDIH